MKWLLMDLSILMMTIVVECERGGVEERKWE